MEKHYDFLRQKISAVIRDVLQEMGPELSHLTTNELCAFLVEPPQVELGDLAFGCFLMAKSLKKSPAAAAEQLAVHLRQHPSSGHYFQKIENVGPYLNLTLSLSLIAENVIEPLRNKKYFEQPFFTGTPKTMIEYSQPNTHKELHVGHMRNMCLGDALIKMMRFAGYSIVATTFPGDVGTHVAKCLWYMKNHAGVGKNESLPTQNKGEWLGKLYSLGNNKLEDEKGTPQEEVNRQALTLILKQLEEKKGEYFDLWKETRSWSIELMKKVYAWAGVEFDQWYWESDVDSASVQYVKDLYSQGKLSLSQGAIGMDLESDKLGFCLLLKSDGTGLYATKDVELARRKFNDFGIEKSIYVVDMRQALHFKQVFKVLEHLGFEQAKNCFHLQYNFVELPDGAMSSRKGNIVPLIELTEKMEALVKNEFLKEQLGDWTAEEVDSVAHQVAQGAIKYGMLRMDNNKKIVFDMKEWLKIDGESGPFIQYSAARINSLLKKLGSPDGKFQAELLTHSAEKQLMAQLLQFHWVVSRSVENLSPSTLCTYLYALAKRFNHFYHECSLAHAETAELKTSRLALSQATRQALVQGLALLGIPCPERM